MKLLLTTNLSRAIALEQFTEENGCYVDSRGILFWEMIFLPEFFALAQLY